MTQGISASIEYERQRAQKWIRLGEMREQRGQYDKAERAYLKAIEWQPSLVLEGVTPNTPLRRGTGTIEDLKFYLKKQSGL